MACFFVLQRDNTMTTISTLRFTATRYENKKTFKCVAFNVVMKDEDRPRFEKKVDVRVLCEYLNIFIYVHLGRVGGGSET